MLVNKIPAGWFRTFAFEEWPCFRPEMWNHIRREESEKMASPNQVMVFSSDTDEMACRRLQDAVLECGLQHTISVSKRDFFDISATDFISLADYEGKGLVVINPPYGMRIGTPESSGKLLYSILKKLSRDFSGWKFALIVPQEMIVKNQFLSMKIHRVFHGGIHLVIALGSIPDQNLPD
jgi:putative N6-adenine-specific DNA methylase